MKTTSAMAAAAALVLSQATAMAQGSHNVTLHVNPRWKECSIQLDKSLTQPAWRQFTKEAGLVAYLRPLADAAPMGAGKYELSVVQWETAINSNDPAWNDTFVHPDADHWLFEGSGLKFPGLIARAGLTASTDASVYLTKNPGANYGFVGAQVQHNLIGGPERSWAGSARVSAVTLYGPEDLNFSVYGVDLLASRKVGLWSDRISVSPYAGVSASLSRSHEKTSVVDLADENVLGAQGMVGAALNFGRARVAAEYGLASVRSFSLKVGVGS